MRKGEKRFISEEDIVVSYYAMLMSYYRWRRAGLVRVRRRIRDCRLFMRNICGEIFSCEVGGYSNMS